MFKNGLMIAGALVLGFAGSSWWSGRAARKAAAQPVATAEVALAAPPSQPGAAPMDLGALRAMIREEVQQARPAGGGDTDRSATGDPSPEAAAMPKQPDHARTPDQVTAKLEATTLVDDQLASGHWRDEDERRWLELRDGMASADAAALRLKLFAALNEGRVAGDFDIRAAGRPRMSSAEP